MRNTARLGVLLLSWSIICQTEGLKKREMLRRRRQVCEYGTYTHKGIDCCLCPTGYYLTQPCTTAGSPGTCELCDKGYYTDHPNDMTNCDPCTVCQERANRKVEKECTLYSNSVCSCVEDHYCEQGDDCKFCHRCDECVDLSVKVACTPTNNTVCGEKNKGSTVAVAVLVPVVILIVVVGVLAWLKKKGYLSKPPASSDEMEDFLPDDVDLAPVLHDIAQTLDWKAVKDVVFPSVTHVEKENIQENYPRDLNEQKEQLLRTWLQKHGLNGAYAELLKKLNKKHHRQQADEVKRIVNEHRNNSAE